MQQALPWVRFGAHNSKRWLSQSRISQSFIAASQLNGNLQFGARHFANLPSQSQTTSSQTGNVDCDHRDVGRRASLWVLNPTSPGSPIFTPDGTYIFQKLQSFLRMQNQRFGFREVITPSVYKKSLWKQSGHWQNYRNDMFLVKSGKDDAESQAEEGANDENDLGLKPMNCPGHCLLFASATRSYRDLPIRYSDFSPLHRDEISGALSGLTRVRCFHQDDGHIFCEASQISQEVRASLEYMSLVYRTFGLDHYQFVLSTRPEADFIGTLEDWNHAERELEAEIRGMQQSVVKRPGEGAFYGPKIDAIIQDASGKTHQLGTVQLDFQLPKRFELTYDSRLDLERPGSERKQPILIHRAMLGSFERFIALYIEKSMGKWPFWLNPRPVAIVTVTNSADVVEYGHDIAKHLEDCSQHDTASTTRQVPVPLNSLFYNVVLDDSSETLGRKVGSHKTAGRSILATVGKRNLLDQSIDVDLSSIPKQADLCDILHSMGLSFDKTKQVKMDKTTLKKLMQEMTMRYM